MTLTIKMTFIALDQSEDFRWSHEDDRGFPKLKTHENDGKKLMLLTR